MGSHLCRNQPVPPQLRPTAVALGFFDGVHLGHRVLIRTAIRAAAESNLFSCVYTFSNPPESVLGGALSEITPIEDKVHILSAQGVDVVAADDFDRPFSLMEPRDFVRRILLDRLGARRVVAGFDYRFGRGGAGDVELLKSLCAREGVGCEIVPPVRIGKRIVSSTYIRQLISEGKMPSAARMLGRFFSLTQRVVEGRKLGRSMDVPTANQQLPDGVVRPRLGVYVVRVAACGKTYFGVSNVGRRPTAGDFDNIMAETHIFDFDEDLYGREIRVEFMKMLRPERKYRSIEALRRQIETDKEHAKVFLRTKGLL